MTSRLYRGDCLTVLPTLPARSVQLIETSPPYNCGYDYGDEGASDRLPLGKYLGMLRAFIGLAYHVLHEGGVLALNLPPSIRTPDHRAYPLAAWAQMEMQAQGYLMSEPIVWVKSHGGGPVAMSTAMGGPANPYLRPTHELVIVGHRESYRMAGKTGPWEFQGYPEVCKDVWLSSNREVAAAAGRAVQTFEGLEQALAFYRDLRRGLATGAGDAPAPGGGESEYQVGLVGLDPQIGTERLEACNCRTRAGGPLPQWCPSCGLRLPQHDAAAKVLMEQPYSSVVRLTDDHVLVVDGIGGAAALACPSAATNCNGTVGVEYARQVGVLKGGLSWQMAVNHVGNCTANDTWELPPGRRKRGQALAFPPELVANLTRLYSAPGDVVLDPFAGTGQVAKVARPLGRIVWLIERQPAYWDQLEAIVQQVSLPTVEMGVPA